MNCHVGRDLAWASSPYSVVEKRILGMLLILAKNDVPDENGYQCEFGSFARNTVSINMVTGAPIPPTYTVRLSLRHILGAEFHTGAKYNNLKYASDAIAAFNSKSIRFYTKSGWVEAPPFSLVLGNISAGYVDLIVQGVVWDLLKNESSGYNVVDMYVFMKLRSKYAMDLLLMFSGLQHPLKLSVDYIRSKWGLEEKYSNANNLILNTIDKGMNELSEHKLDCPYKVEREGGSPRGRIIGITVSPRKDSRAAQIAAAKKYGLGKFISKSNLAILRTVLTDEGIINNLDTIRTAILNSGQSNYSKRLQELCTSAAGKDNPAGWLISMLQAEQKRTIRPFFRGK